jgi:hypothetical protein
VIATVVMLALPAAVAAQSPSADQGGVQWQSDGFDTTNISTAGWTTVSTAGRGLATIENSTLVLRASGDLAADIWRTNDALHLTRPAPNTDFLMRATFGTVPIVPYEAQGIVFSNSDFDFLRIDVIGDTDGKGRRLYASSSTQGVPIVHASEPVEVAVPYDLLIRRDNDLWTVNLVNAEGESTLVASFVHPMIVRSYGPFATSRDVRGTARFINIDFLEGGGEPITAMAVDNIPPLIQGPVVDNLDEGSVVSWTTDELTTGTVVFTDSAGVATELSTASTYDHRLVFSDAILNEVYDIDIIATDASGNSSTATLSDEIYVPPDLPVIEIYGGRDRIFGLNGDPQPTASIAGIVTSPSGVFSLWWRLDDGEWQLLDTNSDSTRVIGPGEFSIELEPRRIDADRTTMEIEVREGTEEEPGPTNSVTVDLQLLQSIDRGPDRVVTWAEDDLDLNGQIANGGWELVPGGVAPIEPGPQRILLIGDQSWSNYEVEFSFIPGEIAPAPTAEPTQPWAGVYLGWRGFDPVASLSNNILRTAGGAGFGQAGGPIVVGVRDETSFIETSNEVTLTPGLRYRLRANAVSVQGGTEVRVKVWLDSDPEPEKWTVETMNPGANSGGSLALVAHRWDIVFETITITPL